MTAVTSSLDCVTTQVDTTQTDFRFLCRSVLWRLMIFGGDRRVRLETNEFRAGDFFAKQVPVSDDK